MQPERIRFPLAQSEPLWPGEAMALERLILDPRSPDLPGQGMINFKTRMKSCLLDVSFWN